jgi:hypothetical protein
VAAKSTASLMDVRRPEESGALSRSSAIFSALARSWMIRQSMMILLKSALE